MNETATTTDSPPGRPLTGSELRQIVEQTVQKQPVTDMHTHVFAPAFGSSPAQNAMLLWGIDELVTYHYLVAEVYRVVTTDELPYERFWAMSRHEQADHIWKHLFVERTPISEACRGVLTTLTQLGLDPNESSLEPYRKWFAQQEPSAYVDRVMEVANVDCITMTNELFTAAERELWLDNDQLGADSRFAAVLRIDDLLLDWPSASRTLAQLGYAVGPSFDKRSVGEAQRCLRDWIARMKPRYIAVSLPPQFAYPMEEGLTSTPTPAQMIDEVLMPVLAESGLAFAMMIGCRRQVNPELRFAGDALGKADVTAVEQLCQRYPRQKFLVTMLSRENQHELCIAARKFGNLMVFGCWWFLNNPSLVDEITRMRIELLGTSFIPQHSDARILDQLIYKWHHSRRIIANVLTEKYQDLVDAGLKVTESQIQRDTALLLRDNYRTFTGTGT